jgi:hypothetical protein
MECTLRRYGAKRISSEGAEKFLQKLPDAEVIVTAKVPREVYDRSYKQPNIDTIGLGFCVLCEDLGQLKKP